MADPQTVRLIVFIAVMQLSLSLSLFKVIYKVHILGYKYLDWNLANAEWDAWLVKEKI